MRAIPKVVFEHFRNPQNKGAVAGAQGRGAVEGRAADSQLILYLRTEGERLAQAGFETERDRASDAPLSLLTTYITGRPLAEVEALTLEVVAAHYELGPEQVPMLVTAFEALQAALANLRGEPNPFAFEGGLVCTCLSVREGRIRRAIRERQLTRVEEVSHWTRACTGCRSCRTDVERILRQELEV